MATKRKLDATVEDEVIDESDYLSFICLGGGNEVGRSCHILQYKGKTVMLDAGVHPAYEGLASLPFYDEFDLGSVDVLLISHFHVDHAASLPYVMTKTNFRGRVFMTHATKAIYKWLIQDSVRVSNIHDPFETLYSESDHLTSFDQIETIDYHTTINVNGIRITPYHAGHVLGGAMFMVEIAGLKILFTGDYSREDDRHLVSAEAPPVKPDVLICESTYGTASHMPRLEKEARLTRMITDILTRGGRVLMPVFALGRAQELLLILDEYWEKHKEFQSFPIYYASNLARKCMLVYQTYINTMNENIKRIMYGADGQKPRNPWEFRHIRALKSLERFEDVGGCVMLASPGMLQNGVSRELLERWAPDPKNGLIITGYSVEGTMAKQIMNEPPEIPAVMSAARAGGRGREEGIMIPRRITVEELSFAAHVDYSQNSGFIEEVGAGVVILVHGEQNNMGRLKSALLSKNSDKKDKVKIYNPKNCEILKIPFKSDKIAKVVGKLAAKPPPKLSSLLSQKPGDMEQIISGVLVQNDFKLSLMAPEDLREYAGLTTTVITCRQRVHVAAAGTAMIRWALEGMFGAVVDIPDLDAEDYEDEGLVAVMKKKINGKAADELITGNTFKVMDCVIIRCRTDKGYVEAEWEGNVLNDGIADAVVASLLMLETSPAAVKFSSKSHSHAHADEDEDDGYEPSLEEIPSASAHAHISPQTRLERILHSLEEQFGDCVTPIEDLTLLPPSYLPSTNTKTITDGEDVKKEEDGDEMDTKTREIAIEAARKRLAKLGLTCPGVEVRVDEHVAKVWFEGLDVECKLDSLRMRLKTLVERAVEGVAPLVDLGWGNGSTVTY
ncbi:Metallo-hydrolase/oxidoreductase [Terfezia boudieri ATCC MYA-4762]|uniref:Metallo-hydrolase/oxidoreductase n=1 Tax=Terfezia boudieri ATCC MYA-4762 TaxID=1051890 RepID=A0A3N4LG60_9PEZI|nr:Metallo-hydrolase/oxidoreductase [Terfezia boudieri ATCC MYA-4762]